MGKGGWSKFTTARPPLYLMPGSKPLSEPDVENSSFVLLGDLSNSSKQISEPSQCVYFVSFCGQANKASSTLQTII